MKKKITYDEALVTYMDILGFRDLVQTETAGHISRTIRLVRDALKPDRDSARVFEMTYQSFSDLTVVSIPILTSANLRFRPGVLHSQITRVADAQVQLLWEGIAIRGGITFGSIVRSYGQLFGPALIRAYELESKKAKYPRIVVDDVIFRELERNPALTKGGEDSDRDQVRLLLRRDEDGCWFIDYLYAFSLTFYRRKFRQFLRWHRNLIVDRLQEFKREENILEKYDWLAKYHNRAVHRVGLRHPETFTV